MLLFAAWPVVGSRKAISSRPTVTDSTAAAQDAMQQKTKKIFYSIPSPMETAELLKKAGAEYDKDILNDANNLDQLHQPQQAGLNLGIYGADLSYASVFNKPRRACSSRPARRSLAKQLGMNSVFSDSTRCERWRQPKTTATRCSISLARPTGTWTPT